jgi:arylsulfatase A-like enzyme
MTGQPSYRTDPPTRRFLPPAFRTSFPPDVPVLANLLASAGYVSACFGKWGADDAAITQGFTTAADPGPNEAAALTDLGIKFVREHSRRRFLLYLNYHLVHVPLAPKVEAARVARFEAEFQRSGRRSHPAYAAVVEKLDEESGRLLETLASVGVAEHTLVIFISDNGGFLGYDHEEITTNAPLREGKATLYEGGIRVPLIVRWPGVATAARIIDVPVINVDLLPTLLDVAGAQPVQVDGVSLAPLLRGANVLSARPLYWHFPHYRRSQAGLWASPASAVRDGRWKLLHFYEDDHSELYDLADDPGESRDLAAAQPAQAAALRRQLDAWRTSVTAQPPVVNPKFIPQP